MRIAQGFANVKALHNAWAQDLETKRLRIFCSESDLGRSITGTEFIDSVASRFIDPVARRFIYSVASRLARLKTAHDKLERDDWQANRIWLLCLAHEVEYIAQWNHIYLLTSRGIGAMSAAKRLAKEYIDTVDRDLKRGKNIVRILMEEGPTSLLLDGDTPSST